jgi:hypothetical protein
MAEERRLSGMTKNQEALRRAAKFLRCMAEGITATPEEMKIISDLCWLCVPMKYRMTKEEIAEIRERGRL